MGKRLALHDAERGSPRLLTYWVRVVPVIPWLSPTRNATAFI